MKAEVAIMDAVGYDERLITEKITSGLGALALEMPRNARVLVKPNLLAQNTARQCTTTHPAVVAAICTLLRDNGCAITIGDSSAFWQPGNTRRAFATSGIAKVASRFGAALVAFEEDGGRVHHRGENRVLTDVLLARALDETDFLVNVPKLKTHSFFRLSGAVKNLFGLVPGGAKYEYHFIGGFRRADFGEKLADIAAMIPPSLAVMDAITGLEGFGPAATGKPRETGLLLVSENPFAVDCAAARSIGLDPFEVESIVAGISRGLIPADAVPVILGDRKAIPSIPYRLPERHEEEPKEKDALYRIIAVRPMVRPRRCDRCGVCADVCPTGAVTVQGDGAYGDGGARAAVVISRDRCLNCYLCYYRCPRKSIALRGVWYAPALYVLRRIMRI